MGLKQEAVTGRRIAEAYCMNNVIHVSLKVIQGPSILQKHHY